MYALDMLDMALRLARNDNAYEDVAIKFFEHFLAIAGAAEQRRPVERARMPTSTTCCTSTDGADVPIKVKSLVGLVPSARR